MGFELLLINWDQELYNGTVKSSMKKGEQYGTTEFTEKFSVVSKL